MSAAVATLRERGSSTGLVIDIGETVTTATPVYQGHVAASNIMSVELGGRDLTDYFAFLVLRESNLNLRSSIRGLFALILCHMSHQ